MRISAKTRYGISAMICLARNYNAAECTTVVSLSESLKISKIYLEQVFSLLKRAGFVVSTKGAQGGYHLAKQPKDISVYDIFAAVEMSLIEKAKDTVSESNKAIETTMRKMIFDRLDETVTALLSEITLDDLMSEMEKQNSAESFIYYI